jgi:hypothetical protein
MNSNALEGLANPAPLVAPIVLRMLKVWRMVIFIIRHERGKTYGIVTHTTNGTFPWSSVIYVFLNYAQVMLATRNDDIIN